MKRDLFVLGNWKMYKTGRQAADYIEQLSPLVASSHVRIYLAVPFTAIPSAVSAAKQTSILIGAQNMHDAHEGAFTGEIAALMLKEAGARFVLLGHSERRRYFHETDNQIHRKLVRAFQDDLQPILCIGETLQEHEEGRSHEVLHRQLSLALKEISKNTVDSLILAYEPVWAIGTGKTATPKLVQEAHAFCRKCLEELFGKPAAQKTPILYGGSVKPDSVKELVSQQDVDGVLVGGASLDPEQLATIIQNCEGVQ